MLSLSGQTPARLLFFSSGNLGGGISSPLSVDGEFERACSFLSGFPLLVVELLILQSYPDPCIR